MQILKREKTNNENELLLIGGSFSRNPILVVGVVHGDEPQGEDLINRYLKETKSGMLFIPCLNPDGKVLKTRTNSNGVDINRNFPTKNWTDIPDEDKYFGGREPASEIETRFLIEVMDKYQPSAVLTLHTPYKIVNYDGPAQELADRISEIMNYPVEESIGYPTPGSFGTYAGVERNIPTITLEMDEDEDINELYPKIKQVFLLLEQINS